MGTRKQYAALGPLTSVADNRAFLSCEIRDGMVRPDRPLVLIWLPESISQDPSSIEQIQHETACVAKLQHPNIIRIHGIERFTEGWARVVQFADGEPLCDVTRLAGGAVDARIAVRIVLDVCEAVYYAHEDGRLYFSGRPILHRGIRPELLLLSFQGVTVVTGYGASALAPPENDRNRPARLPYLAPEQVIGGRSAGGPEADVYAIGAVLYELIVGKAPFTGAPDLEQAILTQEPEFPSLDPLRDRLVTIARRALTKRAEARFRTVAELRDSIIQAVGGAFASHGEVAALINAVMPSESAERQARARLLESVHDPSSYNILTRLNGVPEGFDPHLYRAARPDLSTGAASSTSSGQSDPAMEMDRLLEQALEEEGRTTADGLPLPQNLPVVELEAELVETAMAPAVRDASTGTQLEAAAETLVPPSVVAPGKDSADILQPSAVPRAPMGDVSEITNFGQHVGDSSRSVLLVAVFIAALAVLGLVIWGKKPPEGLDAPSKQVPREVLRDVIANPPRAVEASPSKVAAPGTAEALDAKAGTDVPAAVAPDAFAEATAEGDPGAEVPESAEAVAEPKVLYGTLSLRSEPPVDVYGPCDRTKRTCKKDTVRLGRTPLKIELPVGHNRLRFTDKKTGINAYRVYRFLANRKRSDSVIFGRGELVVNAPEGAQIFLNRKKLGRAPLKPRKVYEGKYRLRVVYEGYKWHRSVEILPGQRTQYDVRVQPRNTP